MALKRFPWKLFSRIIAVQAILLLIALTAAGLMARHFFKKQFLAQVENQLQNTLTSVSRTLPDTPPNAGWCRKYSPDRSLRLTLITIDGTVICDSHHDPLTMENHFTRPEVQEARRSGYGHSTRGSSTLHEQMVYGALRVSEEGRGTPVILRGAIPIASLFQMLRVFDTSLAIFLFFLAIAIIGFAAWSGRRLAFSIGRLLMKAQATGAPHPETDELEDEGFGELSELESSLDKIKRDLETKAESLTREREEHQTIMSALSDAILAVDADGSPLFFNSRFLLLLNEKDPQFAKLRLWEMFRDPEILEGFRNAITQGKAAQLSAVPLDPGGTRRFYSIAIAPLHRASGEIYGAVGIFHDVSELKRAEQMRIDFVANVSHELRTPLTAIKGYADTLDEDLAAGRAPSRDFVDIIRRNAARLMSLITDLLDLSSLESHADDLHRADVSTQEASAKVIKQLEGKISAKNQSIDVQVRAGRVHADPERLEQVLVNLIDNAIKYNQPGGKICIAWDTAENGGVTLRISDTGPGIPVEHHTRLFERFYRVDKARSRELGGTGLGLAIVKHIMQRHGGSVGVSSRLGHGTTFVCRFPDPGKGPAEPALSHSPVV